MSLSNVRGYFRTHLDAAGFREWKDGFNVENVPDTISDRAYHILTPNITQVNHNQLDLQLTETVEVTFFLKGFRQPADTIDDAHGFISDILSRCLGHANRTKSVAGIKNVGLENIDIDSYSDDNDNMVRVTMRFGVLVIERVTDN